MQDPCVSTRVSRLYPTLLFLLFVLIEVGIVLPMLGGIRRSPSVEFRLIETQSGFEVVSHRYDHHRYQVVGQDIVLAHAFLETHTGPAWLIAEWDVTREFEFMREWAYYENDLRDIEDPALIDAIEAAVIAYAINDQELAQFRPGAGPWSKFSIRGMLSTLLYWFFLIVLPLIAVWMTIKLPRAIRAEFRAGRIAQGLCASCGYDRNGLSNKPCPECGEKPGLTKTEPSSISA